MPASHDKLVARYVHREVFPYSAFNRRRLIESGLGPTGVRTAADLRRLPPVPITAIGDGRDAVLRPERDAVIHYGRAGLVARLTWASGWGRHTALVDKVIEPRYRPVHWSLAAGVPIGSSARDLDRLAALGAMLLDVVGIRRGDAVVGVGLAAGDLAALELGRGAARAGVAWLAAGTKVDLAALAPAAVAGPARAVAAALRATSTRAGIRVVVLTDGPAGGAAADEVRAEAGAAAVVSAWAPPGVRSLWVECRAGSGLHTWPAADVVHADDSGEIVWSPVGWAGTVVLGLRTGVRGRVEVAPCAGCGRDMPRVHVETAMGRLARTRRREPLRAARRGQQ